MVSPKFINLLFMLFLTTLICLLNSCIVKDEIKIEKTLFGKLKDARSAYLYTFYSPKGASMQVTNYGASVVSIKVPDRNGKIEHVALGYKTIEEYERLRHYFGSTVGRFGNRIAKGKFTLNGKEYQLPVNDGENSLHGGFMGFDRVLWDTEEVELNKNPAIRFTYLSKDGEEGYPGSLTAQVTYSFNVDNILQIDYHITTEHPTVHNITNHSYFNLSGNAKRSILDHEMMINADQFLPVDKGLIPTGEIRSVAGTPMDFLEPHKIGDRINDEDKQLKYGNGYDHNWILNSAGDALNYSGYIYDRQNGRKMEIFTTEPGMQFYSGNFMDGSDIGHNGNQYEFRYGLVIETQHYPDSPNHENFPSTTLLPGQVYTSTTLYKFKTE